MGLGNDLLVIMSDRGVTESVVEQAALAWLESLGWRIKHGPDIAPGELGAERAGRWHGPGEGPAHYLADTPDGAWAEFLRHEGITRPEEVRGIDRAIWAVEVSDDLVAATREPELLPEILVGGLESYDACRGEARQLRRAGAEGLRALSGALIPGGAQGWRVAGGLQPALPRDGRVITLFGPRPDLIGWRVVESGRPGPDLLPRIRPLAP